MASHDFVTGTEHAVVDQAARGVLTAEGFTLTDKGDGLVLAKRGSMGLTLVVGGLAGKGFAMTFDLRLMVDATGRMIVRLGYDGSSGALKGGAIGYAKVKKTYADLLVKLRAALAATGQLVGEVEG